MEKVLHGSADFFTWGNDNLSWCPYVIKGHNLQCLEVAVMAGFLGSLSTPQVSSVAW